MSGKRQLSITSKAWEGVTLQVFKIRGEKDFILE